MATKEIILKLIKDYYSISPIIKEVRIQEDKGGGRQIHITDSLAAQKWRMFKDNKETPDMDAANKVQTHAKQLRARQLFAITKRVLRDLGKGDEWLKIWEGAEPKNTDDHEELMAYSEGALLFTKVITAFEYEVQEPLFDEKGIIIGNKMIPKEPHDDLREALE